MQLTTRQQGEVLIVEMLDDRIDAACAIQFKERMREAVQVPLKRVVFDMGAVKFLDSSGLGAVVAVMKLLGPDRKLELASLTPTVAKVFALTRMDSVFIIHPSLPEGLRHAS